MLDMGLDRTEGERQPLGDFGAGQPFGQQNQNFAFAPR